MKFYPDSEGEWRLLRFMGSMVEVEKDGGKMKVPREEVDGAASVGSTLTFTSNGCGICNNEYMMYDEKNGEYYCPMCV